MRPAAASTAAGPPASLPLPIGFRLVLDADAKELRPGVWFGGSPARVMTLTGSGRAAWAELSRGPVRTRAGGLLARRLTDAGLAHPVPPAHAAAVTVVVPVLDRPGELDRCLAALPDGNAIVVVDDGSRHPRPIADVARRHGAHLVRLEINAGPAAARNAGLAQVRTELVAFVDSDCVPAAGWLPALVAHLADPLVAAAAPRIAPVAGNTTAGRYSSACSSLDLGSRPSRVAPNARVSYVPTAALVARVDALDRIARGGHVFDPARRVGEDVDLVWRLHGAGWRVRYDPSVEVGHHEPTTWAGLLTRRFRYGTSAAPLARAHPAAATPLVVHTWPAVTVAALLAGHPVAAGAAFAAAVQGTRRTLRDSGVPTRGVLAAMAGAVGQTWLGMGRYATQFAAPVVLAAGLPRRRPRMRHMAAASLLLASPVAAWSHQRRAPRLDPARFVLAHLADEVAYGAGVWTGSVRHRTGVALRPTFVRRPPRPRSAQVSKRGTT